MKFFANLLMVLAGLYLTSCAATMNNTWSDDLEVVGVQKGGSFYYLDEGADFVIKQRQESGLNQAKQYCGNRPVYFLGQNRTTTTSVGSVPVTQTANHSGTIGSGLDSTSYRGSTTYTTYAPTTYTWNHNNVQFLCGDPDVNKESYVITFGDGGAGVCKNVEPAYAPGNQRLTSIASAASTTDCMEKDGWLQYLYKKENKKIHLFVGPKGKELCQNIENRMVQENIGADQANLWLRKTLTCGKGAIAH